MAITETIHGEVDDYLDASRKREKAWEAIAEAAEVIRKLGPIISRSMKAYGVDAITTLGEYPERAIRRCPETGELTVLKMTRGYNVPLVADDVFDRLPPIDPEPSLEEAIAEAQTHRTVWGDVMIHCLADQIINDWTPPTDAELDAAAADGAVDDVFHADGAVDDVFHADGAVDDVFHADEEVE
jgi:hypothetical protein